GTIICVSLGLEKFRLKDQTNSPVTSASKNNIANPRKGLSADITIKKSKTNAPRRRKIKTGRLLLFWERILGQKSAAKAITIPTGSAVGD
ncbi:MAG: hypothetical protein AAF723_01565, partial [Pseudomonadota bacterium]